MLESVEENNLPDLIFGILNSALLPIGIVSFAVSLHLGKVIGTLDLNKSGEN